MTQQKANSSALAWELAIDWQLNMIARAAAATVYWAYRSTVDDLSNHSFIPGRSLVNTRDHVTSHVSRCASCRVYTTNRSTNLLTSLWISVVVSGSNFVNPTHQTTDPTQPNYLSQSKSFRPTYQPNPQHNRTPYNQQQTFGHKEDSFNISQSVKVYQVLLIYQCLSLSYHYQVIYRPTKF